jgi:hypothetical protein
MVEKRDPMPFVPACVLQDIKEDTVRWAAPNHPMARAMEAGMDEMDSNAAKKTGETLPYPKYYLEKEYETETEYLSEKKKVEFSRALLITGFRRLSALLHATYFQQDYHICSDKKLPDTFSKENSILVDILPDGLLKVLINHGPENFAEAFVGNVDTPEGKFSS